MPPATSTAANPRPNVNAQTLTPGHRTTEFWLFVAMILVDLAFGIAKEIPGEKSAMYASWLAAGYGALRTIKKAWFVMMGSFGNIEPGGYQDWPHQPATGGQRTAEEESDLVNRVRHGFARPRLLASIVLVAVAVLLAFGLFGCASTTVYRDGRKIMTTQADAASLVFRDGETSLEVAGLNHSTPTRAGGSVIGTTGTGVGGVVAAVLTRGAAK